MINAVNIKDILGNVRYSTPVNQGCIWKKEIMKHDQILLKFSVVKPINFQIGDYIETPMGKYELLSAVFPSFNKTTGGYDYELTFNAYYWKWKNKMMFHNRENSKEAAWNLTATPDAHLSVVISNLEALGYKYSDKPYTYSIGDAVDMSAKLVVYNNTSILDALTTIAEAWECEWWVVDNIIHLGRCEYDANATVDFVINGNVATMSRSASNEAFATRIYAFGSTRNIPSNYRPDTNGGVVEGIVQKRLMLPEGIVSVDAYEDEGKVLKQEEAVESIVVFEDVYPRMIGEMAHISTKEYVDKIENEDGSTTTEAWTAYRFKDTELEFSADYVLPGEELRIVFTSGALNGMDFAVSFNPDNTVGEKRLFEIVRNEDYGIPLPGKKMIPANGDQYILYGYDSRLVSDQLIEKAENELLERAKAYVKKSMADPSVYDCQMNMIDVAEAIPGLDIGDPVRLVNPAFFETPRQSRIYGFEKNLDESAVKYIVGNTAQYSRLANMEGQIKEITYNGNVYSAGSGSNVYVIGLYDKTNPSNRNVFSAKRSMIEFLTTKYPSVAQEIIKFNKGIELGDFVKGSSGAGIYKDEQGNWHVDTDFLNIRKKLTAEEIEIQTTSHVGGKLISTAGSMVCSGIEGHDTFWRCYFNQKDESGREVENQFRTNDLAYVETFNLKEQEDGKMSNHFLWRLVVGVGENYIDLSKIDDKEHRCENSDAPLVGDNIIQLGNTSDEKRQGAIILASAGPGAPYFRVYKGINTFEYPEPKIDLNPESTKITADSIVLSSSGKNVQDALGDISVNVDAIKQQNDKMWVLWFGTDIPTLDNFPASDWDTAELKSEHVQDIFVVDNSNDDENGLAFRFLQNENGEFYWSEITDKYLLQALNTAKEGKELAQEKTRNFIKEPNINDEYNIGDTWTNAEYPKEEGTLYKNDNLVAISDKKAGDAFCIEHWRPVNNATSSRIQQLSDSINIFVEAMVDEKGEINYEKSGLVTKSNFTKMFSSAEDENGETVAESLISTFVGKEIRDGEVYLESGVKIKGNQIILEGLTTINETFSIDTSGYMNAIGGKVGGWKITTDSIESEKQIIADAPTSGGINENITRFRKDGAIEGKIFQLLLDGTGHIWTDFYNDPAFEFKKHHIIANGIHSTPFRLTNTGIQSGGKLWANRLGQLTIENNCFHIQDIYPASETSPGVAYYQLPIDMIYNGVTLRIYNDENQIGGYKHNPVKLIYNRDYSTIMNINQASLMKFRGDYTGTMLDLPVGKMVIITGIAAQKSDNFYFGQREIVWYVEKKAI